MKRPIPTAANLRVGDGTIGVGSAVTGTYNLSGGTSTIADTAFVGLRGTGVFNISGDAEFTVNNIWLGYRNNTLWTNSVARFSLSGNAVVKADTFARGIGREVSVTLNGGTIMPRTAGKSITNWFSGMGDSITVGSNGVTLDSGSGNVVARDFVPSAASTGSIVKKGSGKLTLGVLPSAAKVEVQEGTLALADTPDRNGTLVHRWSFNGDFTDSVGGQTATAYNTSWTNDNTAVWLSGNRTQINLGANVLPQEGPVTIEMWYTRSAAGSTSQAYALDFGSGCTDCFGWVWGGGNPIYTTRWEWYESTDPTISDKDDATGYCPVEKPLYSVLQFVPVEGGTRFTLNTYDATTGQLLDRHSYTYNWTLAKMNLAGVYLGQGFWNATAHAIYDEMRVWNTALSERDMTLSVALGPDAIPFSDTAALDNTYPDAAETSLLANDYLAHRWTFNTTADDVIGENKSTLTKSALDGKGALSFAGSSTPGAISANLGANVLPTTGPVTLEMYVTNSKWIGNDTLLALGSGTSDALLYAYQNGKAIVWFFQNGTKVNTVYVTPNALPTNVKRQVIFEFVPTNGNADTILTVSERNAETGEVYGSYTATMAATTIAKMKQNAFYLGTSWWRGWNTCPAMDVDDIRVWNAALSDNQFAINRALGADTLPKLTKDCIVADAVERHPDPAVEVAEGATLDLGGLALTQKTLSSAGTVANGTVTVTGELAPGGNGTVGTITFTGDTKVTGTIRLDAGDLIVITGTLDLSGATIVVNDPENLGKDAAAYVFARAEGTDAEIVGTPATEKIGTYPVIVKSRCAHIGNKGLIIYIK